MSEERLPVHINPVRYAEQRRILSGRLPLKGMQRLVASLVDDTGEVVVAMEAGVDAEGIRFLRGRLDARVRMQCQNCLATFEQAVTAEVSLGIVAGEQEAERLPERYEPLLASVDETLFLRDVVEDELILALPIIARHAEGECPRQGDDAAAPEVDSGERRENPFAVLSQLKNVSKPDED